MSHRIYAILPNQGRIEQFAYAANGKIHLIDEARVEAKANTEFVFFVPGTDVLCKRAKLAGQKQADLMRTAEFSLEDDLAAAVEDTHFAVGAKQPDGRHPVHAVQPHIIKTWIERLVELGYPNATLVSEASVVPGLATAYDAGDRYLFAFPDQQFGLDATLADDALQAICTQTSAPLEVVGERLADKLNIAPMSENSVPVIAQLAQWAETSETLTNLRQGAFATRRAQSFNNNTWKIPAIAAAVAGALFLVGLFVENHNLEQLEVAMKQQGKDVYAALNPGQPIPPNLDSLTQAQATPNNTPKLDFLNATALLYSALPNDDSHAIRGLRFNTANGRLVANMSYPAYGADLDLKKELESKGLIVTLGDSRQQDGHVLGDVTMEAAQ